MAKKKLSLEERKTLRKRAMPEVAKLIAKYDRKTIGWCLNNMKAKEKKLKEIASMKRQLSELQRGI